MNSAAATLMDGPLVIVSANKTHTRQREEKGRFKGCLRCCDLALTPHRPPQETREIQLGENAFISFDIWRGRQEGARRPVLQKIRGKRSFLVPQEISTEHPIVSLSWDDPIPSSSATNKGISAFLCC